MNPTPPPGEREAMAAEAKRLANEYAVLYASAEGDRDNYSAWKWEAPNKAKRDLHAAIDRLAALTPSKPSCGCDDGPVRRPEAPAGAICPHGIHMDNACGAWHQGGWTMKPRSPRAVDPAPMMDRTRYPFTSDEWEQPEQFYKTPRYFVGPAEHACCYDAGIYDGHEPEFHSEGRFLGWYVRLADVCDEETAQRMCDLLNAATP